MLGAVRRELLGLFGRFRPRLLFWTRLALVFPEFSMPSLRAALYRLAGCDIAKGVALEGRLELVGGGKIAPKLHVGSGSIMGVGIRLGLDGDITIGQNVAVGPYSTLFTATHGIGPETRRMRYNLVTKPITIEDGVWIGMNTLILPGVTVGRGAIVSAGAVVRNDVPANTLVEGNPAVVIRQLPSGDKSRKQKNSVQVSEVSANAEEA